MRAIVDRRGLDRHAASISQMGRFETAWLATEENLTVLTDLSGTWIDRVHDRKKPRVIVHDMDSSESPTPRDSAFTHRSSTKSAQQPQNTTMQHPRPYPTPLRWPKVLPFSASWRGYPGNLG